MRGVDDRSANDDTGAGERDSFSARAVAVKRGDDDRSARHVAARPALRAWRRHRVARDRDVRADPEQIAKRTPRAPNADALPAGPTTVWSIATPLTAIRLEASGNVIIDAAPGSSFNVTSPVATNSVPFTG